MLNQRYISDAGLRSGINGCVVGVMVCGWAWSGSPYQNPICHEPPVCQDKTPSLTTNILVSQFHWTGRPELWLVYSETFKILSHSHQEVGFPHFGRNHRSARLQ